MKKTNRKGFTIVELVIVIAVIAILAAVLIPTFASLINKANRSADIQAVHQMNTLLATYTDGSVENVADAIKALAKENIDLEDYKALQTDHYFYFTVKNNIPMVVYLDKNDNVVYPEDTDITGLQLMSLSGEIPLDDSWESKATTDDDGKKSVELANGGQLADLMIKYSNGGAGDVATIKLTENIDLKGSTASFGKVTTAITLDGGDHTISGLRADNNSVLGQHDNKDKKYGYALFNWVEKDITVKNIKISNAVIEDTDGSKAMGHSAVLIGSLQGGKATISDVTIDSCVVYGADKVGSVIGSVQKGTATLSNVKIENTELYGNAFIAVAIGYVAKSIGEIKIDSVTNSNMTLGINKEQWSVTWYGNDKNFLTNNLPAVDDVKTYFENDTNMYIPYYDDSKNKMEGAITKDLYWYDQKETVTYGEYACIKSQSKSETLTIVDANN